MASAYAVFILILAGIVILIIEAVDKMLERKEEYQQRYSELYNATRDTLFEYDVDLDQVRGIELPVYLGARPLDACYLHA
eukprot:COSAG02_NODE_6421_length_3582_cov_14.646282_4_plen_80_part_00